MDQSGGDRGPYVFLSYASADRERALHLADLLEARGVSVWIDRKSIAGGTSWLYSASHGFSARDISRRWAGADKSARIHEDGAMVRAGRRGPDEGSFSRPRSRR